jgi:hypothetical protein
MYYKFITQGLSKTLITLSPGIKQYHIVYTGFKVREDIVSECQKSLIISYTL